MPYAHTTWGTLKADLIARLGGGSFWTNTATYSEVGGYLREALRVYAALSGRWKKRVNPTLSTGVIWYDLTSDFAFQNATDRELAAEIMRHLLEPPDTTSWTWLGTEQFSIAEIQSAINRQRDRFLLETGIRAVRRDQVIGSVNATGRYELAESAIDIRRAAWVVSSVRTLLDLTDEHRAEALLTDWHKTQAGPKHYSVAVTPPITVQLIQPPLASGTLEMVVIEPGAAVDLSSGVALGVPDNYAWAVKWGAIADLLSKDGQARDHVRARYAAERFDLGVAVAKLSPSVAAAYVDGEHLAIDSVHSLDSLEPGWESDAVGDQDRPRVLAMASQNLAAFWPAPDDAYDVDLDIVAEAPIPSSDGAAIQIGEEELDAILDYAFHIACFKMGGEEFNATAGVVDTMIALASVHNERIRALTRDTEALYDRGQREQQQRKYRDKAREGSPLPTLGDS